MTDSDKKMLAIMPELKSRQVEILLEEVIGCRWTISVLGAVARRVEDDQGRSGQSAKIASRSGVLTITLEPATRVIGRIGLAEGGVLRTG